VAVVIEPAADMVSIQDQTLAVVVPIVDGRDQPILQHPVVLRPADVLPTPGVHQDQSVAHELRERHAVGPAISPIEWGYIIRRGVIVVETIVGVA